MHHMSQRPPYKHRAWLLAVLLVVLLYGASTSGGMAQIRSEITSAAVLPVVVVGIPDGQMIAEKATAAVSLALEDSGEFRVIAQSDLRRELRGLSLDPPLSVPEQIRLGERIPSDKVISGTLRDLSVNPRTGQCQARLELKALDIPAQAVLNGAIEAIVTKVIPGWEGDDVRVQNEGLRQVAEVAVASMLKTRIPRGNVDLVEDTGLIHLNLGASSGLYPGLRMLVKRPEWRPDAEVSVMRDIGIIEAGAVHTRISTARSISGQSPRTGDKVYALYTPPQVVQVQQRRQRVTKSLRSIGAVAMLLGCWAIGSSHGPTKAPAATCHLYQIRPGAEPSVRINVIRTLNPDPEHTNAFLFYRAQSPGAPAEVDENNYLVGALRGGRVNFFEDTPERRVGITFTHTFEFFGREGELEEGSIDITYNHLELIAGDIYYYKVRRVVDPLRPQIPLAQVDEELEDVAFEVDPADALSEASAPCGPVTYFQPAALSRPVNGSTTVNPSDITFEWLPSTGANEYQVQVYKTPILSDPPDYRSQTIIWTGQSVMQHRVTGFPFRGDQVYYWVVASRVAGEGFPLVRVGARDKTGWVLSDIRNFQTVQMPPPGPAAIGQTTGPRRSAVPSGFWGQRTLRRVPRP